jgi:membrane-bound lytic murein transglycosylase D
MYSKNSLKYLRRTWLLGFLTATWCLPAHAVDSPFVRPGELEPDIKFWQRVYTEAATDGGYIHDEEHLDVVYERVTFPADWTPSRRQKFIDETKAKYARMLRKFAGGGGHRCRVAGSGVSIKTQS